MSIMRKGILLGFSLVLGFAVSSCKALNPNTEGQIMSALEAKMSEFKVCYETALDKDRETRGTVGLKLKIHQESGSVTSSSVENSTIIDNEMNQCVANVASDISLPEPPGVPVEGHYDINFDFEK
jgi:hypothetical protein